MSFEESMRQLAAKLAERRKHVTTEEAAKMSLVVPLLQVLGFDASDPLEVVPEFGAEWTKPAEKIDYALMLGDKPAIFIEAKAPETALANHDAQLAKYFNSTPEVKFAVITNGIQYRFFSDLEERNILDKKPFFEFDACNFTDSDIDVMSRFRKEVFNAEELVKYAEELVYLSALKSCFEALLRDPSDDLVKLAVRSAQLVEGNLTGKIVERFRPLVKQSLSAAILAIVGRSFEVISPDVESPSGTTPDESLKGLEPDPTPKSNFFDLGLSRSEFQSRATSRKPSAMVTPDGKSISASSWKDFGIAVVQWLGLHSTLPPLPFGAKKFQLSNTGASYLLNESPNHASRPMTTFAKVAVGSATLYLDTNRSTVDWLTGMAILIAACGEDPARFRVELRETADDGNA